MDTALLPIAPAVVGSDFDSVIAKIIITARTWPDAVSKARRALDDAYVTGIQTNLALLRAIVSHPDFEPGACDTQWLESNHDELLQRSRKLQGSQDPFHGLVKPETSSSAAAVSGGGASTLFRKDDAWTIDLKSQASSSSSNKNSTNQQHQQPHHLQLTKVLRNDFPDTFAADILYTAPGAQPVAMTMDVKSTSASGSAMSSQHPQGSKSDPNHVIIPLSGKLVEVLVDAGDVIRKDDPVCVIKQMKMEIEVRSHKAGLVTWVTEAEDDEDVAEGMLAAVVEDEKAQAKL